MVTELVEVVEDTQVENVILSEVCSGVDEILLIL